MLGDPLKYGFLPNYAMTEEEVFTRTAQSIISTCGTSSLNLTGPNNEVSSPRYRLPSWVPDFTRPLCDRFKHTSFLSKAQVDHHFFEDKDKGPIPSVIGLQLDKVKSTSRIFYLKSEDPLNIFQSLERSLLLRAEVRQALFKACCADFKEICTGLRVLYGDFIATIHPHSSVEALIKFGGL
jgi:hypothetical protein